MLKIEVTSTVNTKSVTKKATGEVFNIPEQICYAHVPGEKHPVKMIRSVGRDKKPLAEGMYLLAPSSIYVDRYGQLQIKGQFDVVAAPR